MVEHVTNVAPKQFATEFSQIGCPPGYFPECIATDLGNGNPFVLRSAVNGVWTYRQINSDVLLFIIND